jgi:hypothetical protein
MSARGPRINPGPLRKGWDAHIVRSALGLRAAIRAEFERLVRGGQEAPAFRYTQRIQIRRRRR